MLQHLKSSLSGNTAEASSIRVSKFRFFLVLFFMAYCCVVLLRRLLWLYQNGGDGFQQGDWLINFASGPVRRGFSGELVIALSDLFRTDVVLTVIVIQAILVFSIVMFSCLLAIRERLCDRALLLLFGPGFISFFVYMTIGAFRKELLVYFAFLPLLLSTKRNSSGFSLVALSSALFIVAVAFHEGNSFAYPFWILAAALRLRSIDASRAQFLSIFVTSTFFVGGLFLFALANTGISDINAVCSEIMARGADPKICDGIIRLMGTTTSVEPTGLEVISETDFFQFFMAYLVCLFPIILVLINSPSPVRNIFMLLISAAMFLPLYILAVDWGRWIVFHTFLSTLIVFIYVDATSTRDWFFRPIHWLVFPLLLLCFSLVGVTYMSAHLTLGVLPAFFQSVQAIIQ